MKILIMGLPGSGKTTLAKALSEALNAVLFNGDWVRTVLNHWDFSESGRRLQADRMKSLADYEVKNGHTVICDFVCPTEALREHFDADFVIWMDTISEGRFDDTNKIFESPSKYDVRITKWIDLNQLSNYLEDGNLGTEDTPSFLRELFKRLDK